MRIIGCDYSTHYVDFVAIEDDKPPKWTRYLLKGHDSFERARSITRSGLPNTGHTFWDDVLALGIEEPAGRNPGHLFRIQGGILTHVPHRMLVEKWMPSQWRKSVKLKGNCSKSDVEKWVKSRAGVRTSAAHEPWQPGTIVLDFDHESRQWPQDACDAYCIAVATAQAVREEAA